MVAVVTPAAALVQLVPVPPPAKVASTFTVTDVGTTPVSVREVKSRFTAKLTVSSGVIKQEQQEINSSPESKVNILAQMLPD
jgi:hypothetical protein